MARTSAKRRLPAQRQLAIQRHQDGNDVEVTKAEHDVGAGQDGNETGSQVVGYVLVQALAVLVILSLLQLAYALHIRNVTVDAASEGARRAALAYSRVEDGRERTEELLKAALGSARTGSVDVQETDVHGHRQITVTVVSSLPILGPWGLPGTMEVKAHSWCE